MDVQAHQAVLQSSRSRTSQGAAVCLLHQLTSQAQPPAAAARQGSCLLLHLLLPHLLLRCRWKIHLLAALSLLLLQRRLLLLLLLLVVVVDLVVQRRLSRAAAQSPMQRHMCGRSVQQQQRQPAQLVALLDCWCLTVLQAH